MALWAQLVFLFAPWPIIAIGSATLRDRQHPWTSEIVMGAVLLWTITGITLLATGALDLNQFTN